MKKVLIVSYSQTGQLNRILDNIATPLRENGSIDVEWTTITPERPYPFPWPFFSFFDLFPESVYLDGPPIKKIITKYQKYDLIILGYQVWFLSPSLPVSAFLHSVEGRALLKNTPVVAVNACRNMWLNAYERLKEMLNDAGAHLLDHVVLVDQGNSFATFITTPRWLLTGKKGPFLGMPEAGVSEKAIKDSVRFGRAISYALDSGKEKNRSPLLTGLQAVDVNDRLIASERIGYRSFRIWGKLIRKAGKPGEIGRRIVLTLYILFLVTLIVTIVPVTVMLRYLMYPFARKSLRKMKHYFELPSGSGSERMQEFYGNS